jgi:hypothetical protein
MAKQDYIPHDKYELGIWAKQLSGQVLKNVGIYGITEASAKTLEGDVANYNQDLDNEKSLIDQKRAQVKKTQADRVTLVGDCRELAQLIKASPDYTEKVGEVFDIVGAETPFNQKEFKPELNLRKVSNGVEVSFVKSHTDGINLYRRMEGETNWQYMARDTHSPYIDTKIPEGHTTYEYMAWGVISDQEIGIESGIEKITV